MSTRSYDVIEGIATGEEYVHIREVCGLGNRSLKIGVLPEHHGHGLGELIVQRLVSRLREYAPATAYVSLIADGDGDAKRLYARHGFAETAPASVGMALQL